MRDLTLGLELIKKWEGLKLKAYKDPVGIPTIGYGTTVYPNGNKVKMGDVITEAQAVEYLKVDAEKRAKRIDELVSVDLDKFEFSALVSFTYNVGLGAFEKSTLLRILNEGKYRKAADEFDRWVKAGGKTLKGLVNRRNDEEAVFRRGEFIIGEDVDTTDTSVVDEAIEPLEDIETLPGWFQPIAKIINLILEKLFKVTVPEPDVKEPEGKQGLFDLIMENSPNIGPKMTKMAIPWLENAKIKNKEYMMLVDFDLHESRPRGYIVNLKTGTSTKFKVAHGSKSDPNKDGTTDSFSNVSGSNKSSLGAMVLTKQYGHLISGGWSKFPYALQIEGLQPGLNDKVKDRAIVFHSSAYVNDEDGKAIGDSLGCFAVSEKTAKSVINMIDEGALLFAYHRSLD